MEYNFTKIEAEAKSFWNKEQVYKVTEDTTKPKYYVLDMFPYPSGAGLHVGHPLGYIASDIYARYKRLCGYNVLHPMGFDAFGLPAEQYALETGQHPAVTTEKNIKRYHEQLDNIGFCYDWSREVRTSDPAYYKWTQWIFLQLFHSWYDRTSNKARPVSELIQHFNEAGNSAHPCPGNGSVQFDAATWTGYSEDKQREVLMQYRLAYQGYAQVWWCEALGTVLANDEVVNGVSERGGHPVERKNMRQWFLRITEYADRLLTSLDNLEWSEAMKEMQRNWIGKSTGAVVKFGLPPAPSKGGGGVGQVHPDTDEVIANTDGVLSKIKKELELSADTIAQSAQQATSPSLGGGRGEVTVFTTRPDTIFGVDFLVLAPEHELVAGITTADQKVAVDNYVHYVKSRSERERQSEVKNVTGCFTGAYAIHPLNNNPVPVWISEYVLAGYGTGAIMGVPSGDERDHRFAQHFNIPITNIFGDKYTGTDAVSDKSVTIHNSGFISGMSVAAAASAIIDTLEKLEAGTRKVNFRLRDAGFSRQRYWGEPFPVVYINGIPYGTDELPEGTAADIAGLPVELPHVEHYRPGPEGQGPLANVEDWVKLQGGERETNTMPGYAGSSWYFLRYMDPNNDAEFASRAATDYWKQVDLYVGGTEHAVGHLLYSRMWTKALCDLGHISFDEPFRKLLNQGMIQGSSRFVYRLNGRAAETIVAKILRTEFKELNFLPEHKIGDLVHDFVSEEHKVIIEITGQKIAQNKHKNIIASAPDYSCITISNEEIFAKLSTGCRRNHPLADISALLRTLIDKKDKYCTVFKLPEIWFVSYKWKQFLDKEIGSDNALSAVHVDISHVDGVALNLEGYKEWRPEYADAEFILEDGAYLCGAEVEKMSKSKYNVVNPDDIVAQYGADTFRMYEMFLGPIDVSKPWDTKGIEGVHRFLKKLWRLYADEQKGWMVTDDAPTDAELRILHKTIRKIGEDMERFSFNTSVSQLMITVNDLTAAGCHKRAILEPLAVVLCPFAPHLAEELWKQLGRSGSVVAASFPAWEERYVTENSKKYPVAINGKTKLEMEFALDAEKDFVQSEVLGNEQMQKLLEGKTPKNFIFVKGKMINVVV